MELNQLEQLICIAQSGSLSSAAKELSISQPALSRSMQRLEQDFGIELFDHYKNKIVLNKNGELAVEHAKKILKQVQSMVDDVRLMSSISIASCTPAPIWDIEPMLHKLYGNINIVSKVLDQYDLENLLLSNKVDMILTPFEIQNPNIVSVPYLDEHLSLSIPKEHPLSHRKEVSFKDLEGETMLLYSNIGFWYDMHIKTMPKTHFITQENREVFNQIKSASTFPVFTSNLTIKREGITKNRVIIPFTDAQAQVTFYLGIRKKDKNTYSSLLKEVENYFDY